jgi:hypothetical protein
MEIKRLQRWQIAQSTKPLIFLINVVFEQFTIHTILLNRAWCTYAVARICVWRGIIYVQSNSIDLVFWFDQELNNIYLYLKKILTGKKIKMIRTVLCLIFLSGCCLAANDTGKFFPQSKCLSLSLYTLWFICSPASDSFRWKKPFWFVVWKL